jgi:SAM-dependent methyltransferase
MTHYDEKYWEWQKQMGMVGGVLDTFKFKEHIDNKNVHLLDFGCGGGFILNKIDVNFKYGFEINENCHESIKNFGITPFKDFNDISNNFFDIIISHHALEHVHEPLSTLKLLYNKLKTNGKIVIVLPCEQALEVNTDIFFYKENDMNQHLYSWCPQSFGNLVKVAGFNVVECTTFQHQWAPNWYNKYNDPNFHSECFSYAKNNNNFQIKLVATK